MDKRSRFPVFALIMLCVGIGLILFGAIAPSKIFSGNNTYSAELDRSGFGDMKLRVTLNTEEDINQTITAYINEEEIYIIVKEIDAGVYKGSASIDRDEYFMSSESDVSVIVSDKNGNAIRFKQEDEFGMNSGKIVLTIFPIFIGAFVSIVGLVLGFAIMHRSGIKKAFNGAVKTVTGTVATITQAVKPNEKFDEKHCEYCDCYNEKEAQKCKYCGAPLKKM